MAGVIVKGNVVAGRTSCAHKPHHSAGARHCWQQASFQHRQAWVAPSTSRGRQLVVNARAERGGGGEGSFTAGFIVGGVVFGALGFLFAPQISKALLGDDQRLWLPRFLDDEQAAKDPEQTKQDLIEKIAQLNASIDEVASQLKTKDDNRNNGTGVLPKNEIEGIKIVA